MVESSAPRSTASTTGFFRVPGLFVRLSSTGLGNDGVDPESVWSPTTPLDNLRSSPPRVGLGLVDALTADAGSLLFGGKKASLLDSIRPFLDLGLANNKPAATPDEVADSEEYTCVIVRGANPRTTHIFGGGETLEVLRLQAVAGRWCSPSSPSPSRPLRRWRRLESRPADAAAACGG